MPLLALDDTDTPDGGCTTHAALCLARAIDQADGPLADWALVAPARLVRLNPAAPHRTRGNGALVLPLGVPKKSAPSLTIGKWPEGSPIHIPAKPHLDPLAIRRDTVEALRRLVNEQLPSPAPAGRDPQPAALLLHEPPSPELYQKAVTQNLEPAQAMVYEPPGTIHLTPPGRRGEIGALAAAAWPGERGGHWSWEYIGYRESSETAAERRIPPRFRGVLGAMDGGFDNHDPATGRLRAVPRTPCPVRFAVRGCDPHALVEALTPEVDSCGGWLLLTNQATGDHARYAPPRMHAHSVTRLQVEIAGPPIRARGGHLLVPARSGDQTLTLAAFEPTKNLRDPLQELLPGDRLEILGRSNQDHETVAVEAFRVQALVPRQTRGPNPRCPRCGRATKSMGHDAGYRCLDCRVRLPESGRSTTPYRPKRLSVDATYQVPDHVRGHLLPPLSGLPASKRLNGDLGETVPPVFANALREDDPLTSVAATR